MSKVACKSLLSRCPVLPVYLALHLLVGLLAYVPRLSPTQALLIAALLGLGVAPRLLSRLHSTAAVAHV